MPNHCGGRLTITGTKKDMESFRRAALGVWPWGRKIDDPDDNCRELMLCNFVPPPIAAINDYQKIGYSWCSNVLGTKWGCYDIHVEILPESLVYTFDTAWSPFEPSVLEAMSVRFPDLHFVYTYDEPGCQVDGEYTAFAGEVEGGSNAQYTGLLYGLSNEDEDNDESTESTDKKEAV